MYSNTVFKSTYILISIDWLPIPMIINHNYIIPLSSTPVIF